MGTLLTRLVPIAAVAALLTTANAVELSDRHDLTITLDTSLNRTRSPLGPWPDGAPGKLRIGPGNGSVARLAAEYSGQIGATLFGHVVVDALADADTTVGATEGYLEWRPLPRGPARHRMRFGAFYPGFSLENPGTAWQSPYSRSFSAINSWIAEEIRPVGAEWHVGRPLGAGASPHELGARIAAFYGNDAAGTLLFWRGWAVHDRQTRLNERLSLPSLVFPGPTGDPDIVIPRRLDPIAEIDDRPGFYATGEWRYAKRALVSLSFYDNRAEPTAFRDGQWGWATSFWHLGTQVALPAGVGLVAQTMRGETDWLIRPSRDGTITPDMALVSDRFQSSFVLLSKAVARHRVSLRVERFGFRRPGRLGIDSGDAAMLAYAFTVRPRLELELEWLRIDSSRDLWPRFFGRSATRFTESQLALGLTLRLFDGE